LLSLAHLFGTAQMANVDGVECPAEDSDAHRWRR
jgi:hypothetical protein